MRGLNDPNACRKVGQYAAQRDSNSAARNSLMAYRISKRLCHLRPGLAAAYEIDILKLGEVNADL